MRDRDVVHRQRADDEGVWNIFKAWFWFPLHLVLSICFVVVMLAAVDGHAFKVGSPGNHPKRDWGQLYQTEVTGLASAALLGIRLIASCGSVLLLWRLVFLLLEKHAITVAELTRIVDSRIPLMPRSLSPQGLFWPSFSILALLLLWPHALTAPVATSALEWIPALQVSNTQPQEYSVRALQQTNDRDITKYYWRDLNFPNTMNGIMVRAMSMVSKDPSYAFDRAHIPSRRHLYFSPPLTKGGVSTIDMPYFEIKDIKWLDPPEGRNISNFLNSSILDRSTSEYRSVGTLGFSRARKWVLNETRGYVDRTFVGKKNISIFVGDMKPGIFTEDGILPNEKTPCPNKTTLFGRLPPTEQFRFTWYQDLGAQWVETSCYMFAEVTMHAGRLQNYTVNITSASTGERLHIANTFSEAANTPVLAPDIAVMPTLDMMTDVLANSVYLNATLAWGKDNIEGYVRGMLTMGYHATWSSIQVSLTEDTKNIYITPYEDIIRASVNRSRMFFWLAMNACLTLSATIIALAYWLTNAKTKIVRDATLAALTSDITAATHHHQDGLCNAVALDRVDQKLPKMRWAGNSEGKECGCREVVVVNGSVISNTAPLLMEEHRGKILR